MTEWCSKLIFTNYLAIQIGVCLTFNNTFYTWCNFMVCISCWFLPFCDARASHSLQMAFSLLEFHLAGLRVCPCVLSHGSLWGGLWNEVSLVCVVWTWGQNVHFCFHFIRVQVGHSLSPFMSVPVPVCMYLWILFLVTLLTYSTSLHS